VCFSAAFDGFLAIIIKADGIVFNKSGFAFGMVLFAMPIRIIGEDTDRVNCIKLCMQSVFSSEVALRKKDILVCFLELLHH